MTVEIKTLSQMIPLAEEAREMTNRTIGNSELLFRQTLIDYIQSAFSNGEYSTLISWEPEYHSHIPGLSKEKFIKGLEELKSKNYTVKPDFEEGEFISYEISWK